MANGREEIQRIRETLQLTQEEFAHTLGVTVSSVNRWESGKTQPSRLAWLRIREIEQRTRSGR